MTAKTKRRLATATRVVEVTAWIWIYGVVGSLDLNTISDKEGFTIIVVLLAAALAARVIRKIFVRGQEVKK